MPVPPFEMPVRVQPADIDALGHVNNIVYLRWFESARITYFERLGWLELQRASGVGPILHSTQARFRAPVQWPDTITVGARIAELQEDRFTMLYEVRSERLQRVAAEGSGVVVSYDYRQRAKVPLPEAMRAGIHALEGWAGPPPRR